MSDKPENTIDWGLTTWEGATRESMRRWSELPLERIIAALEEMQQLNDMFRSTDAAATPPQPQSSIQEESAEYRPSDTPPDPDKP
jgi:hypothetical protein